MTAWVVGGHISRTDVGSADGAYQMPAESAYGGALADITVTDTASGADFRRLLPSRRRGELTQILKELELLHSRILARRGGTPFTTDEIEQEIGEVRGDS